MIPVTRRADSRLPSGSEIEPETWPAPSTSILILCSTLSTHPVCAVISYSSKNSLGSKFVAMVHTVATGFATRKTWMAPYP